MTNKILIVLFFPVFLLFACKSDTNTATENATKAATNGATDTTVPSNDAQKVEEQEAWDKMMVIHDEVMPKMKDINAMQEKMKELLASPKAGELDANQKKRAEIILQNLNNADEGMMSWMNSLKNLPELRKQLGHEAVMLYLNEQTKIITNIATNMKNGVAKSKEYLQQVNE